MNALPLDQFPTGELATFPSGVSTKTRASRGAVPPPGLLEPEPDIGRDVPTFIFPSETRIKIE
jgi:hypothetical protein